VQRALLEKQMGYDAALVSLDLAILYAQEGQTAELKRLADEVIPAFESREVHREAWPPSSCSSRRARRSG
jgi:hypothetical protein